jgi:hypothetical protein
VIRAYDNKHIHEDIAKVVARHPEFAAAAAKVFAEVKAAASAHIDSGELFASYGMEQGKADYTIAPSTDHDAAVEFGHYVYQDRQGRRTGREGARYRTWVPGLNILRGVVHDNGGF